MTAQKQKSKVRVLSALTAIVLAAAVFVAAGTWLRPIIAYAAPADPTLITVTYYDGPLTRGFTWQTETGVTGGEVQIVEKTGTMTKSTVDWAAAVKVPAESSVIAYRNGVTGTPAMKDFLTWKADYDFTAAADGKTYFYRVGSEGAWSPVGEQKIDSGALGVNMLHVSDPQGRDQSVFDLWKTTLTAAKEKFPDFNNFIFTGDFTQEGRLNGQWAMALNTPQAVLMDTVIMPAAGNHDWERGGYCEPAQMEARFHISMAKEPSGASYFYYSYDIGNVHVTVLNTNEPDWKAGRIRPEQVNWLKADLAAAEADPKIQWKVVAAHHPMVSAGRYATETNGTNGDVRAHTRNMRRDLMPVFAEYKVDLVLNGHEHVYVRSEPVDWAANPTDWGIPGGSVASKGFETGEYDVFGEDRKYMENPGGTVYVDMSPAGGSRRQEPLNAPDINELIGTVPASLPDAGGKSALQPEPHNNADSGTKGMFGALKIEGGMLLYETYSVDGGTPILIDYFGVAKEVPEYAPVAASALTVTGPVADAAPSTSITAGTGFTAALSWNGNPAKFEFDTAYTATVTLKAQPGYSFAGFTDTASIAGFKVNGIAPAFVSSSRSTLVFTVAFPKTTNEEPKNPDKDNDKGCACGAVSMADGGGIFLTLGVFIAAAVLLHIAGRRILKAKSAN